MKNILFTVLLFSFVLSFGNCGKKTKCSKKKLKNETTSSKQNKNEVWLQYDETKCANPWHLEWFMKPTEEQLRSAVKSNLTSQGITILAIASTLENNFISCDACTCPSGRHFYVRTNSADIDKLKALKFYEVKTLPNFDKSAITK